MLLSTQTECTVRRFGIENGIERICLAGFDAIDMSFFSALSLFTDDNYKELCNRIKTIAHSNGAIFNQAHAPFGGGYDYYTQNLVPTFPRIFECASILGVRQIIVHPLQRGRYYGHEEELFELNMDFYRSLIPLSEKYGVKIALENMWQHNPRAGYIVDDVCADPEELAKYYDTLNDSTHFTVCLDTGHVALCNREPQDAIRTLGSRLGALHVHDVDYKTDMHTLPGMGLIDWEEVTLALAQTGYSGEFTFEADSFLRHAPDDFYDTALKFMADRGKNLISHIEMHKNK